MNPKIKEIYDMLLEIVEQLNEIDDSDKVIIENLAFNIHTIRECEATILKEGFIVNGMHGLKENPAINIRNKAETSVRQNFVLLGLDFSSKLKKQNAEDNAGPSEFIQALMGGKL